MLLIFNGWLYSFSDRSPDIDNDSDDDDGAEYNDYSSNDDMSDSEPTMTEHEVRARQRKHSRSKNLPVSAVSRDCEPFSCHDSFVIQ